MSEPEPMSERDGVDVAGPADAPPVVLVHGTVFNRTMWAPQRDALSEEYRVVAPDLPGHGQRRDEAFRMAEGVRRVKEVVDGLSADRVHLVGLSLGGYVATEYVYRYPEDVRDVILSGSSANPVRLLGLLSRAVGKAALLASKSRLVERGVDRVAARWVRSRDLRPEHADEIVRAGFDLKPFGQAGVEIAGEDFRAMVSSFGRPTLVLNGQWDLLMRRGEEAHAEAAADASITVIDGAGHACNLDEPAQFEAAVRRFIEDAESADRRTTPR